MTAAVHEAGGKIVAQIWHMGRLARPDVTGLQPLSSSVTRAPYHKPENPYAEARAATLDDIRQAQDDYATAARNAIAAGFDGVQLHGANGYLIDQFLRDGTNFRDDEYGGSPENRIRFMREAVEAVIAEVGAGRTAIRLSPNGETQGADDSDPESGVRPCREGAQRPRHRLPRTARAVADRHVRHHRRAQAQPQDPRGVHRPADPQPGIYA